MCKIEVKLTRSKFIMLFFYFFIFSGKSSAAEMTLGGPKNVGGIAASLIGSFTNLTKLITAGSYIAGLAFSVGAIMKFKQHKDNPTQIPIGTPIALVFIAAALLFLPSILGITCYTMFGSCNVAGPTGSVFSS